MEKSLREFLRTGAKSIQKKQINILTSIDKLLGREINKGTYVLSRRPKAMSY